MKLASYAVDGRKAFGAVIGDAVVTLNERLGDRYPGLRQALAACALADLKKVAEAAMPDHRLADVKLLPPIPDPEKILCAGINYRSHAAETGRDLPKQPSMFIRLANTLTGHEGELIRPSVSQSFDFEGELALVIGRAGRHIPVEQALDHVAGYTCFVDGSVRDYQKISVSSGKNFPGPQAPDAGDAAQRPGGAEIRHRSPDLFRAADHSLLLRFHTACSRRHHRDRNTGRRRPPPHPAAVDEGGRCAGSRDFRNRDSAQPGGG